MSSSKREQAYRNIEQALSYWQEKLAYYERELSITAGAAQRFELEMDTEGFMYKTWKAIKKLVRR